MPEGTTTIVFQSNVLDDFLDLLNRNDIRDRDGYGLMFALHEFGDGSGPDRAGTIYISKHSSPSLGASIAYWAHRITH